MQTITLTRDNKQARRDAAYSANIIPPVPAQHDLGQAPITITHEDNGMMVDGGSGHTEPITPIIFEGMDEA